MTGPAARALARGAAFAAMALACALAFAADQRVALLIGNNAYSATPLANAVNDARDLAGALQKLGFTTIVRENATRRDMIEALRDFGQAIDHADAAVFFYAGHALQFKDRNYLVPIDSEMRSEEDIALYSVEIQQVFDRMDRARTRHNVIILDACRDNPFASTFKVASPGLAQSNAPSGTLIAYATAPGSVAADGFGRNGMYTKHILQHIAAPDLPVEIMFKRVREGVEKDTQNRQTPWDASSLKGEFTFNSSARGAAPVAAAPSAAAGPSVDVMLQIERDFWVSVRDSNRPEELQAYLDEYPNGKFVTLARLRLQQASALPPQLPPGVRMQLRSVDPKGAPQPPAEAPKDKSSWLDEPRLWNVASFSMEPAPAHSAAELFRKPLVQDMQLSPDGRYVAAIMAIGGRHSLAVLDTEKRTAKPIAVFDTHDVVWVRWISKQRLVLQTDSIADKMCECRIGALTAVDVDGAELRTISTTVVDEGRYTGEMVFRPLVFVSVLPGDTDDFIAQEYVSSSDGRMAAGALYRVNSRTGRRSLMSLGRPDTGEQERWVLDNAAVPRVFSVEHRGITSIYYRAGPDAPWSKLDEFKVGTAGWAPLGIAADGKSIYASSWKERDKQAIVLLEPRAGGASQVIATHPYVDVKQLIFDNGVPVGISYDADRPGHAWFDEELERIQATVDRLFPRSTNELMWSRNRERVLFKSSSDVTPGAFYFFDRASGRITWIADRSPWLKREAMSETQPVRYKARDGLNISAYLTLPRVSGTQRPPLVVMAHGGPFNSGYSWEFDAEVQQLAARGFAVLQPNFRGTTRYGWKHFRAGFGQWGRGIVDDLADGVAWAVSQGYVDKDRVCIYGGQFGGYAALMGLINTPELYRCAVDYMGYVDLAALFEAGSSVLSSTDYMNYDQREMIGDPDKDPQGFAATSPVEQAARIRVPALLAYGSEDMIIPLPQATRLKSALERHGKKFEWMVIEGAGHAFADVATRVEFQEAAGRFLAENLK